MHSVIFGGFSAEAIADRNNNAAAKLVAHGRLRLAARQAVAAEGNVDHALEKSPTVQKCIVLRRTGGHVQDGSRAATSGGTT